MNILIANTGCATSNEVKSLVDALSKKHKVTVACMMAKRTATGLAFSPKDVPVRVNQTSYGKDTTVYEFGNQPADAVSITMLDIMSHKRPDLVICGINNGLHMGQDIYCSSNIGMAMESAFFNIPTIAVGVENKPAGNTAKDLENAVKFIEKNVEKFANLKLAPTTFLNINVPTVEKYTDFKGVKVSHMSIMSQLSSYVEKTDGAGNVYYWVSKAERKNADDGETLARTWFDRQHIVVVPLSYDATDYGAVETWDKQIRNDMKTVGGAK